MIHQHIFASPKPGLTAQEFQQYWLNVHAVNYASKIPQIKKYKIDTRDAGASPFHAMPWEGIAEIWLRNDAEQLASMQTAEFLQGARLDEPKWAAFWNTLGLDTETTAVSGAGDESAGVKLVLLSKRRSGMPLGAYRQALLDIAGASALPGLTRLWQCFTRDGGYEVGEPRFDGVTHYWFESAAALSAALVSAPCQALAADMLPRCCEPRYLFAMAVTEHWVIGPQARD